MALDLNKAIRNTIQTGKVHIGSNQALSAVDSAQAKAVVLAKNCPDTVRDQITGRVPVIEYPGMSVDLGTLCGKPFAIAAITVIEPGESEIMSALRE